MTWLFDSHIHLSDSAYLPEIDFILTQMNSLKIKACCVSMNFENSQSTLSLSKKVNLFYPLLEFILNVQMIMILKKLMN